MHNVLIIFYIAFSIGNLFILPESVWFSVLIIGCVVVVGAPFVIYAMRKPSWKDPEAAADFAPFHWEQQPVVAAPVHTNAPEPMAKPSDTELHNK